jgi:hypothetical protein
VVRSLSDVTDATPRRWDLPVRRWMEITRGDRRGHDGDEEFEG